MAILYKVQTGAFKSSVRAAASATLVKAAIKKYLKKSGSKEDVSIAVIYSDGYYKVQEGAFSLKENAVRRRDLVRAAGVYAIVTESRTQDAAPAAPTASGAQKVYDLMKPYIDSKTAHSDFVKAYNAMMDKLGHSKITEKNAWCTEFVNLMFWKAGYLDLIGYAKISKVLMETAKKKGTWKSGSGDIRFGDVVIYQNKSGSPNHTEFALGGNKFVSGNYNGGVHVRTRPNFKTVKGRIRPKYPT